MGPWFPGKAVAVAPKGQAWGGSGMQLGNLYHTAHLSQAAGGGISLQASDAVAIQGCVLSDRATDERWQQNDPGQSVGKERLAAQRSFSGKCRRCPCEATDRWGGVTEPAEVRPQPGGGG